jgi:UDP-glucose 4-epimerase
MTTKVRKKDLKPIERSTPKFLKAKKMGWITRLPILKQLFRKKAFPRGFDVDAAGMIPVNIQMGDATSEIIPKKLMDYFIDKAGTIALIDCPCRVSAGGCKNHSDELGCVWMGKGAANLDLDNLPGGAKGRFASKEEAREHVRLAIEDGLVPSFGKLRGDAKVYNVLEYEDEFMNFCFCCSCCCVNAGIKYGNSDFRKLLIPMEGVSISTDPEKCIGCGECFKVCIFDGLKMVKGKSTHTKNCVLCGRCETVCPEKAITIKFDESFNVDNFMEDYKEKFDSIVDISG